MSFRYNHLVVLLPFKEGSKTVFLESGNMTFMHQCRQSPFILRLLLGCIQKPFYCIFPVSTDIVVVYIWPTCGISYREESGDTAIVVQGNEPTVAKRCLERIIVVLSKYGRIHHKRSYQLIQLSVSTVYFYYIHIVMLL